MSAESAETALSHGQLYSWREVETYPAECRKEANLPAVLDVRGASADRVEGAVRTLVGWYEILRTTYHVHDGTPLQRVHDDVELPLERVDRPIRPEDVERMTGDLLDVPLPMTGALPWRALLVTTDGEPMLLVFSLSHVLCDVWSSLEVARQVRMLLEDPDAPSPDTPSQREVARAQHDASTARRRDASDRHWVDHWDGVARSTGLPDLPTLPYGTTKERIQATLSSRRLGVLAADAAGRHRATAPATLLAMLTAAVAGHTGARRVPVGVMSSNRFPRRHRRALGTFNQLVPVVVEVDGDTSLGDHIAHVHWTVARAYRHSCYDIDRVAALASEHDAAGGHDCWFNHQFPFWFNYVALDDEPPADDDGPAALEWAPHPRACGQPIDVRVNLLGGTTGIRLRTDPDVADARELTALLRTVALGTTLAASDDRSRITDLWTRPADDLPPALFPAPVPVG